MSLFLERIEISGVRSVGWSNGGLPGLVLDDLGRVNIVSAPNGVGKTSVIDALTLALTGEPRRRGRSLPLAAVTHASRPLAERARVVLRFSGGKELYWTEPDKSAGDAWLAPLRSKAAELLSTEARDPAVVSNLLRLTHLLPQGWGERFIDQKGDERWALVERALGLDGVRAAVREGQNRGAIRSALESAEAETTRAADLAGKALERWTECVANWSRAREGARETGARSPADLKTELDALAAELGVQAGPTPAVRLRQVLAERRAALRMGLDTAGSLTRRRQEAEAQTAGAEAALAAAERALRDAESALQAARVAVVRAEGAAARAALPELRAAQQRAAAAERACTILAHVAALRESGAALREAEARLSGLADAEALDKAVVAADVELEAARTELNEARRHITELERDHGEVARLLRELRPHIANDECEARECPVCGTGFSTSALLERLDDRLGSLGDAATETARVRSVKADVRLDEATTRARAAKGRRDAANEARRARDAALRVISAVSGAYPALAGDGPQDALAFAETLRAKARKLVADDDQLAGITPDAAHHASELAAREVLAAEEAVRAGDALLMQPAETLPFEIARHRRDAAQKTVREAVDQRAAAARRLDTARGAREALAAEWARVVFRELADTPLDQVPAKQEAIRHARTLALDLAEARLGAAERSAEAYTRLDAVRLAEDALRTEARAFGEELPTGIGETWVGEVETRLRKRADASMLEASRIAKRVSMIRDWIGVLASELQRYEGECLEEMDPFVDRFRDALAPTMRWRMKLEKFRNHARSAFANEDAPDADPSDLLSEGEHTAVALAYLFAFHTRFQWSRWPALVLDDPFQAADVVRSGALLDVLQGLSVARGTQILLTTHDPQLADWARRKMRNAGVDARLYELERTAEGLRAHKS